jgi:hypothetical protein
MPKPDDTAIPGHPAGLPPEAHNDEQDPVGTQAQDVVDAARRGAARRGARTATPPARLKAPRRLPMASTPRPTAPAT